MAKAPAPRRRDDDRMNFHVRLPRDLVARLDTEGEARLIGRNRLIELLLERALADLPQLP